MFSTKKIAYNTIVQIIGKSINILIGVLAISYLTRYLSPSGFGQYTTVLTFLQMFSIFLDFGLYIVLLQELGKPDVDKDKCFSNILTLRIISGLSFFVIAPLIGFLFPYPMMIKFGILVVSIAFFFNSMIQVYVSIFQKEMVMHKIIIAETIGKIIFLLSIIFAIYLKGDLLLVLFANNIYSVVLFIIVVLYARKYIKYKWTIDLAYWKKIILISWPIAVTTILNLIYFKADTLILSIYSSDFQVGIYSAPYKILEVITGLPHMILGLVLPIFTFYYFQKQKEDLNRSIQKMFNLFVVMCFLIIVLFIAEAKGIIYFIAGPKYYLSVNILKVLIWPTVIIFFSSLFNYAIIAVEKQKKTILYFFITAIVSLIGYFIFIPRYGYWGAAYMTLFAESLITVFSYILLKKYTGWKIDFAIFIRTAIVSIFVYLILYFININFVLEIFIGTAIYCVLLVVFKVFSKDLIKELISFKKS
ncbi:MAG: flippase [Patescibacteria group bacterium]|nr:flippase [Patescibacteria group bacterium]MDD4304649.1 flippase [Patescibacteria group bacterium]MDD4695710.1 flippase [Patescibacteria group bacterium]